MVLQAGIKPNLLAIVPPYAIYGPPAGAAALLAYLKASGCHDFSFLDLRLFCPDVATPTYRLLGVFGESFVLDIPDLPLVLALLENVRANRDVVDIDDTILEPYCLGRGINSLYLRSYLQRMDGLCRTVFDELPDLAFVGFSVWTSNYLTTLLAAAHLKRRGHPPCIVAGGPQVSQSTASAQLGLRAGLFDAVVVGEGEETLLDLYGHYSSSQRKFIAATDGVVTHNPATRSFQYNERRLLRLADLPVPDFDEMHLPAYRIAGKRVVTYQLSRGCTDKCSFCSEWVFWRRFRLNKMDKAVADVAELQRRWGAERIWFTDSLLNGQMNRLRDFTTALLDSGVEIWWSGYMRAQMDQPTAELLHKAGCMRVFIGVESLADETLKLMNKRMTETQNLAAVQAFLDAGIEVKVGLIPGFPGDTRERFIRTATHLRRMQAASSLLSVSHEPFVVLPGQPIYDDLSSYGLRRVLWPDEIVDICPDMADISRQIGCRIEGDNQGIDRLGEHIISLSLVGPAHPTDRESDETHEALSMYRVALVPLAAGVWLVRTLSPRGHIVGAILSADEHAEYLTRGGKADARWVSSSVDAPVPVCEMPEFASWFSAVLARHQASFSMLAPRVTPARYRRLAADTARTLRLALGPFTILRRLAASLWLADLFTGEAQHRPASDAVAAALLRGEDPLAQGDAITLAESGYLVYASLPEVEPVAATIDAPEQKARAVAIPA
ncbi:MAG TPA: radical SAM protein [Acetobacteraceae bacterium]|nr:radical SAM protein [Acetobacteraceae bacterium]